MGVSIDEKARKVIEHGNLAYNILPFEERKRIGQYVDHMKILTMYQLLHTCPELLTEAWKKRVREWLGNCVNSYNDHYRKDGEHDDDT